jgi:hypothetical protein
MKVGPMLVPFAVGAEVHHGMMLAMQALRSFAN